MSGAILKQSDGITYAPRLNARIKHSCFHWVVHKASFRLHAFLSQMRIYLLSLAMADRVRVLNAARYFGGHVATT